MATELLAPFFHIADQILSNKPASVEIFLFLVCVVDGNDLVVCDYGAPILSSECRDWASNLELDIVDLDDVVL